MKPKGGRFPDQHLFARSKRLSDFIVEGEALLASPAFVTASAWQALR